MAKKHGHSTPPSGLSKEPAPQQALPNQRRRKHHPALYLFFTSICLVFFLFFFYARPVCKGASTSISTSSSPESELLVPPRPLSVASSLPTSEPQHKMSTEQTFIAIKPDGVQRGLVGSIIARFENRGYKLVAIKLVTPGKAHLEEHYADLKDKPFFAGLVEYMNSGPICAMVWEGRDAVKTGRTLLGATNPLASAPGTIRGDFAIDVGRNVCHGSDSVESAKKEIALWFKEGEVVSWKSAQASWIYEKP
ncbi:nucleoside diphosphate kinase [Xylaria intraflava]|nr:nucleoside diphosphate kinase [Xylaria intraflava]